MNSKSMPRVTDYGFFKTSVVQFIFVSLCLIGLVLVFLIFIQNYKKYLDRNRDFTNMDSQDKKLITKDLRNSFFLSVLIVCIFILLIFIEISHMFGL